MNFFPLTMDFPLDHGRCKGIYSPEQCTYDIYSLYVRSAGGILASKLSSLSQYCAAIRSYIVAQ